MSKEARANNAGISLLKKSPSLLYRQALEFFGQLQKRAYFLAEMPNTQIHWKICCACVLLSDQSGNYNYSNLEPSDAAGS
jgi:hypothetical protein